GAQASRIRLVLAIREFLDDAGYPDAKRRFLTGDASLRAYEYVYSSGAPQKIRMDWRPHPEGPPVYDGKPYPKVARRPLPSCTSVSAMRSAGSS
ncbi:bifunctional tRNA (adenosine(37)-N6)-threonylcarbamoyltransferase complex ATPase subunit type 1 TsaE/phosphotransferase, partial [Rhizobium ruizarguesonis]